MRNGFANRSLILVASNSVAAAIWDELDTPVEVDYHRNGGILQTVLRRLAG